MSRTRNGVRQVINRREGAFEGCRTSGRNVPVTPPKAVAGKSTRTSFSPRRKGGLLTELPSASFASSKYTRMANTVTSVLTPKEFVRCAGSKYLTPSFTK